MTGTATSSLGIDTTVPSAARMYDFWLGGHDNFAVDRAAALAVTEAAPEVPLIAAENRKFLQRAVRYLAAEAGITQFLDIGTGLPAQGNVHEVAQQIDRHARVVYADNDPMVIAHSRALKTGGNTAVITGDLRNPDAILAHPSTRRLIDFTQPLAVLLVAVLHFISDRDYPHAIVETIRDALPAGSYLVVSHATGEFRSDSAVRVVEHYKNHVAPGTTLRTRAEIERFFAGLDLVSPGIVQVPYWCPGEPEPAGADKVWFLGGVGRKAGRDLVAQEPRKQGGPETR